MTPVVFAPAVLQEAQDVGTFREESSFETVLSRVKEMLGRTFWDRALATELDR